MFEVTATYPAGDVVTFYEHSENSLRTSARLAHPRQAEPTEIRARPFVVPPTWHVYSVDFSYYTPEHARPRSIHGDGLHVCFSYDEKEASNRLSLAENTLRVAIVRTRLIAAHQYSWPDGSLLYWFASELPLTDFDRLIARAKLAAELRAVSTKPFTLKLPFRDGKKKLRRWARKYGESVVTVGHIHEVENPRRYDPCKWRCVHLLDYFNRHHYVDHVAAAKDPETAVTPQNADAFETGFCVAFGHQNLFTPYVERHSGEELSVFIAAYYIARFFQFLTE